MKSANNNKKTQELVREKMEMSIECGGRKVVC